MVKSNPILLFLVYLCVSTGTSEAASVFTCKEENGTIVFQDSPCAEYESIEIYQYQPENSSAYQSSNSANYRPPYQSGPYADAASSGPSREDAQAIAQIRRNARATCGTRYSGRTKESLRRSQGIVAKQESESGRRDRAVINCHLNSLARIEKIKTLGLETALHTESQQLTRTRDYSTPPFNSATSSNRNSAPKNDPAWLLDPYSGQMMPRTGAGYTDPTDGTFYHDTGAGVVNTKTGEFIPTHQ
ncbi:MAG: DUF4124 domain-containing protein [Lysobacterales bacterium]